MNDDMPWVDLTPEEIQELRSKKQELPNSIKVNDVPPITGVVFT